MFRFTTSEYKLDTSRFGRSICFAVISDLHSGKKTAVEDLIKTVADRSPDYVLMPGDIFEKLDGSEPERKVAGFELIAQLSRICPVFMSIGNHENGGIGSWNVIKWSAIKSLPKALDGDELDKIFECGATLLDDGYVIEDGIAFGGLSSGLINEKRMPDTAWLDGFCELDMPKVLLCHHPEYYKKYLKSRNIDLTVSGHAHGGQWRIFGRGVFAPGQGIFPKYTSGIHDGRFVISRGLAQSGRIPRIFNTPEIVFVTVD